MGKANITFEMKRKKGGIVYTITLHGHGSVVYKSGNQVKMKDIQDIPIKKKDFIKLLTDFENFPYPSENMIYDVDDDSKDDYTYVSFSIKHADGDYEEKEIRHYNKDERIPQKLKDLEDKVDVLTKSDEWLKNIEPEEKEKKVKTEGKEKRSFSLIKNYNILPKIIISIVIIILILLLFLLFIPDFGENNFESDLKVEIYASNNSTVNGSMINFKANLSNNKGDLYYFWDFGDGVNSSEEETAHTYLNSGVYDVKLTVSDSKGKTVSDSKQIFIS